MKRYLILTMFVYAVLALTGVNSYAQEETGDLQGAGFYVGGHLGLSLADGDVDGVASVDYGAGFGLGGVSRLYLLRWSSHTSGYGFVTGSPGSICDFALLTIPDESDSSQQYRLCSG